MPYEPNIAGGIQPVQVPNALANYAQFAQLQKYTQDVNSENKLNAAYAKAFNPDTGEVDVNKLRSEVAGAGIGSKLPAIESSLLTKRKLQGEVDKNDWELTRKKIDQGIKDVVTFDTVAGAQKHIQDQLAAKQIDSATAQRLASTLPASDAEMPAWQVRTLRNTLDAKDKLEQHFTPQNYGGGQRIISTPKYGGGPAQVVQGSQIANTMTPGEIAADKRAAQTLAKPVWNEAGQGWVTAPTKENPTGSFVPVPEVQASKDQRSAVKALKTAGYDVETGADEISKLIEKSTGGMAQQAASAVLGAANITTSGREAIGRLKTRANQIGLDILGGKLGVGISNDDRKFIVEGLGNVADPSIPAGERLAAWDEVKKRMVSSGMLPTPTKAPAAAGAGEVDPTNPLLK